MLSAAAMWIRTEVMPRWLGVLTGVLALVLLLTIGVSAWLALLFPARMLIVSFLILIGNYRRNAESVSDVIVR